MLQRCSTNNHTPLASNRSTWHRHARSRQNLTRLCSSNADNKSASTTKDTLSSLDALLGVDEPQEATPPKPERPPPGQPPAPSPRTAAMDSGSGKYLDATSLLSSGSTANAGPPSDPGTYSIPTVQPRLTYLLLAVNLAVYSAGVTIALTGGNEASNDFFLQLAKDNSAVVAGEYWRLLSATFLHAGLLHLGLNCYALYALGTEVESVMGYAVFLTIYLLSGVSGSVVSFMVSDLTTVGASGAIFGLLGSLAAYFLRNRDVQNSSRQLLFIILLVSLNLALGSGEDSLLDNTGHIAGFVAGGWLGWTMGPRYIVLRELDIPAGSTDVPEDAREQQVVVDTNTTLQRVLVAGSFVGSLCVALAAGVAARGGGGG